MGKNNIKFTQEYVIEYYLEKGCTLLDEYINSTSMMGYICKCGATRRTTFSKFKKQKHGCRICNGLEKYSHEQVEKIFEDQRCKLLSSYTGANDVLNYVCECGEKSATTLSNFKKGKRCKSCGLNKLSDMFKLDAKAVRQTFIDNNCTPLFDEYCGVHTPLEYVCECGNKSMIAFADFKAGKRCNRCRVSRIQKTKYKFGSQICSTQQKFIHNVIGGELNFPSKDSTLDIAFVDDKIYLEYDGSGHDLSVKLGDKTKEQFELKEKRRNYALYRDGWKKIQIISTKDLLPSKEKIDSMFNFALEILKNRSWVSFDIDNSAVEYIGNKTFFDFGRLKKVKSSDIS